MVAQHIHITGASGSGTSTLGASLAARLGCAHFDSDDYFWIPTQPPFVEKRPRDERVRLLLRDLLPEPRSVVSGSVAGWDATLEDHFDLIVFLTVPTDVRLARLRRRELARLGSVDEEFIEWAGLYDSGRLDMRTRAVHEEWLQTRRCAVLRIDGTPTPEETLRLALAAAEQDVSDLRDPAHDGLG